MYPIQILDVKKAVEAAYKHPVDWQRLIFSGKVLEDEKTVSEYNLQADKMVILYIKVRARRSFPVLFYRAFPLQFAAPLLELYDSLIASNPSILCIEMLYYPIRCNSRTPRRTLKRLCHFQNPRISANPISDPPLAPFPYSAKPTAAATPAAATPATPAQPATAQTPAAPTRPATGTAPAQTPASPTAPARAAGPTNNTTLTDEEFNGAVQNLVDMAFDRAEAVRALNAAYGDSARAVEYILSGNIPNINNGPRAAPMVPSSPGGGAGQGSGLNAATGGAFAQLRQLPQFQALIAIIQQNPAMLEPLLQQLAERDPEIVRLIHENRDEFLEVLQQRVDPAVIQGLAEAAAAEGEGDYEEGDEEDFSQLGVGPQGGVPAGTNVVNITPAEKEAIDRLVDLGFDRNRAIEAFLVCNRDEEMAANYLFEQQDM